MLAGFYDVCILSPLLTKRDDDKTISSCQILKAYSFYLNFLALLNKTTSENRLLTSMTETFNTKFF